jgi:hypothetical protein
MTVRWYEDEYTMPAPLVWIAAMFFVEKASWMHGIFFSELSCADVASVENWVQASSGGTLAP